VDEVVSLEQVAPTILRKAGELARRRSIRGSGPRS